MKNKYFFKLILKHKIFMFISLLLIFIYTTFYNFNNYYFSKFMDIISKSNKDTYLKFSLIIFLKIALVTLITVIINYIKDFYIRIFIKKLRLDVKNTICDKIISYDYKEFKENDLGKFVSWFTIDIEQITSNSFLSYFYAIESLCLFLISIVSIFFIDIISGITIILLSIFMLVFPMIFNQIIEKISKDKSLANEKYVNELNNYIMGYEIFLLSNLKNIFKTKINFASKNYEDIDFKFRIKMVFVYCIRNFFVLFPQLVTFMVAAMSVVKSNLDLNNFMGIQLLSGIAINNFSMISVYITELNSTFPLYEKYFENIKIEDENKLIIEDFNRIKVENITFGYNEKVILKDFTANFVYPNKYFVIGESGGGKSTLIKLIQGLYKVNSGKILLDDVNINDVDMQNCRKKICYLSQDVYLFNASIRDNITLWQEYSDEEIWNVLETCNVKEFVKSLDKGLDFNISENGKNISGGQKQRIAIARLLIRKPKYIIIDEGTSQLDEENRKNIEDILLNLKNTTVIIITHNLRKEKSENYEVIRV